MFLFFQKYNFYIKCVFTVFPAMADPVQKATVRVLGRLGCCPAYRVHVAKRASVSQYEVHVEAGTEVVVDGADSICTFDTVDFIPRVVESVRIGTQYLSMYSKRFPAYSDILDAVLVHVKDQEYLFIGETLYRFALEPEEVFQHFLTALDSDGDVYSLMVTTTHLYFLKYCTKVSRAVLPAKLPVCDWVHCLAAYVAYSPWSSANLEQHAANICVLNGDIAPDASAASATAPASASAASQAPPVTSQATPVLRRTYSTKQLKRALPVCEASEKSARARVLEEPLLAPAATVAPALVPAPVVAPVPVVAPAPPAPAVYPRSKKRARDS